VAVALPGQHGGRRTCLTVPFADQKRVDQVLPAEVEGTIPFDLEEVVWDHSVLSVANGKSELIVGVVAARGAA